MNFEQLLYKTYSAWMGKLIGIRLGAPVENWTAQEIADTYGKIEQYLVDYGIFAADDDANGPLFFVRSLLENPELDPDIEKLGAAVLDYIAEGHGFFWWGGQGISTEDTAYHNLLKGMPAAQSGKIETNGEMLAEQIGGQIFSDGWGYISAGDPHLAARLAKKMSSVTHDGDGVWGGVFIAVCIALAYHENDCRTIIEQALAFIPEASGYARMVRAVLAAADTGLTQPECRAWIQQEYSYDRYPGVCHILPNSAIMIMAMLYGENDFSRTLTMLCEAGWDTDCTCGNVGSILGVMTGIGNIDPKWTEPINDLILASSFLGAENITTVSHSALMFSGIAARLNQIEIPESYQRILDSPGRLDFFTLPNGTQAYCAEKSRYSEMNLRVHNGALKCIINQGFPGQYGKIFKRSYYRPEDVYDCRYQPSFTPILHPGETITMQISNPRQLDLKLALYVLNRNGNQLQGEWFTPDAQQKVYSLKIAGDPTAVILEYGLIIQYQNRLMHDYFLIHEVFTDGRYAYEIDWRKEVHEDWGLDFGEQPWSEISQCTTLRSRCRIGKDGLILDDDFILFTDTRGQLGRAEITFRLNPKSWMELRFQVRGARRYQALRIEDGQLSVWSARGNQKVKIGSDCKISEIREKSTLIFTVKNDLMIIEINGETAYIGKWNVASKVCGAFGIAAGPAAECVILDCKLEAI